MESGDRENDRLTDLPVLPLRDMVVFPHGVQPLFVGTARSIRALEAAAGGEGDRRILLLAKRDGEVAEPAEGDVYDIGVVGTVLQMLTLPDGMVKVLVEGQCRAAVDEYLADGDYTTAHVTVWPEPAPADRDKAIVDEVMELFERYRKAAKVADDVAAAVTSLDRPGRLIDTMAAQLPLELGDRQRILEALELERRRELIVEQLMRRIEAGDVHKHIRRRVKKQMEKSQREYYLNEQMKAIQKELGGQAGSSDADDLERRIEAAGMSKEAREKAGAELAKLRLMPPMSAEATVVRGYLDWVVGLPWKKKSRVRRDLRAASDILEADHHGLEEVKSRILEYLAVQGRVRKVKGPVLCLVGPPGVGKTSLGESIARATNRRFVRMALGGVRDEAEIRGHRRTYIGSMPGKVLQKLSKAGVRNPLFLFDEVDKMGQDVRGDPASALLEVLDPEQNSSFNDHYIEVDYDLSDVFFVCTSNSMNVPPALLDRMEVIRLPGYTEDEKLSIASRFLVPKQKRLNGVAADDLELDDGALTHLVRYYTREAGVRGLEREIARICRKIVTEQALGTAEPGPRQITEDDMEHYNGVRKFTYGLAEEASQVGVVTGLAWTQAGGELLNIEAIAVPGTGRQIKTGSLGDVMQESHPGGHDLRSQPCRFTRDSRRLPRDARRPHPRTRGRDAQGRAERGHRHVHGTGQRTDRHPGVGGRGDDGRDHVARSGAADRRPEGKAAGRAAGRHRPRGHSEGERAGPQGDSRQHPRPARGAAGGVDGRDHRPRARTPPGAPHRGGRGTGGAGRAGPAGGRAQHALSPPPGDRPPRYSTVKGSVARCISTPLTRTSATSRYWPGSVVE